MTYLNLRHGVDIPPLVEFLEGQSRLLRNVDNLEGFDRLRGYREWSSNAIAALRRSLRSDSIERLVMTPGYWFLHGVEIPAIASPAPGRGVVAWSGPNNWVLRSEIEQRMDDFDAAAADLKADMERWREAPGNLVVADTNVYLHHRKYFWEIDWTSLFPQQDFIPVTLVIPMIVVDEVDKNKVNDAIVDRDNPKVRVRHRARQVGRKLDELFAKPYERQVLRAQDNLAGRPPVFVQLQLDAPQHVRLPQADDELVARTAEIQTLVGKTRPVYMVSNDTGPRLRARIVGLQTVDRTRLNANHAGPSTT